MTPLPTLHIAVTLFPHRHLMTWLYFDEIHVTLIIILVERYSISPLFKMDFDEQWESTLGETVKGMVFKQLS